MSKKNEAKINGITHIIAGSDPSQLIKDYGKIKGSERITNIGNTIVGQATKKQS